MPGDPRCSCFQQGRDSAAFPSPTSADGSQLRFFDFSDSLPVLKRGSFKSYTDAYGQAVSVTASTTSGSPATVQQSSGGSSVTYNYSYVSSGANEGLLAGITEQVNGTTVRQVVYAYYSAGDSNGNIGDLQTATLGDGSANVLQTSYYRYYLPGRPTATPTG